ncbi:TniB family NTP-binding protein [Arthrobacter sp. GCM10027362]|uniref:TniB family NTP-binding protein n=1 Tax=Arthrobacter sp. GCM10027362 TaxID=3273379 RepID=UPI0036448C6B
MTEGILQQPRQPIEDDTALTRWESLNRVLGRRRERFTMVDRNVYEAMKANERREFNEARIKYMAGGMIVTTETINDLVRQFTKADMMNSGSLIGRRGVMLSAPASSGKSTACLALIQYYLSRYEKENPGAIEGGAVPAIYASIPATRTVKGTLQRIARFLALPFRKSDTETDLASMLQEVLPAVGTRLIVLDEVQMLSGAESTSRPAVNNLKDLTNYFQGTIVYSGLNLTGSALLFGEPGLQLRRRVFNVRVANFTGKQVTEQQANAWAKLVKAFAKSLPLYTTDPDAIQSEADWLREFTGGNIGTLKAVLFDAAATLILQDAPDRETLTRQLLEQSVRDYAAETDDTGVHPPAPLKGARTRKKLVRDAG